MAERYFEFCVFDPEGDYGELEHAVSTGDAEAPPTVSEAVKLLRGAGANVVINTQGLKVGERPAFFAELLPQVAAIRAKTGRPHWLLIDEAHHLLPAPHDNVGQILSEDIPAAIFITVHPEAVSPTALRSVETVVALGDGATEVIEEFCRTLGIAVPEVGDQPRDDEVLVWMRSSGEPPRRVKPERPQQVHKRHTRKYAEGDLGKDLSFYFRGPDNALNLQAQNLMLFLQIGHGVDDRTWTHHLRRGDYSAWFRRVIKNDDLAAEAAQIEGDHDLDPRESRRRIEKAVTRRFTAPASAREH